MAFGIEAINLTSVDPETGLNNTAAVYTVEGISRQLSIGELVMVICLARAVKMEEDVTAIMSSMNETTHRLEQISTLEDKLTELRAASNNSISAKFETIGLSWTDFQEDDIPEDKREWWNHWLDLTKVNGSSIVDIKTVTGKEASGQSSYDTATIDKIVAAMEAKMDELNTFSQQSMIQLQSATNKRDQAYDLCSAILKSFNTVLIGSANNL